MTGYAIVSLNVGKPGTISRRGRSVASAIHKSPVNRELFLTKTNFAGDGQADRVNHGGADKAVCAYPYDHYAFWRNKLGIELGVASFGENLTVAGLTEDRVCVGDRFRLGEALLEVSQPRQPCYKLAWKLNVEDMVSRVRDSGYTGYYFRVLKEGTVRPGDRLEPVSRHPAKATIAAVNRLLFHDMDDKAAVRKLAAIPELADNVRKTLLKRLDHAGA